MKAYQNELETIDTPEKAYFLGFMYGDGCITKYVVKNNKINYQTRISIHFKDKNLIKKLNILFPFLNINIFDYSKYNNKAGKQISLRSGSIKLFKDLELNGLFVRKSYENKEKLKIPKIDENLLSHFIRGFFDADGSVYKLKSRQNSLNVSITSNSKNLIYEINTHLRGINIYSSRILEVKPTGRSKQIYYNLSINRKDEISKFKNYIYQNSNIHLERKKIMFDEHKDINKVLDRNINCPNCKSRKNKKNGIRNNQQRFHCNDCNKNFFIKSRFE